MSDQAYESRAEGAETNSTDLENLVCGIVAEKFPNLNREIDTRTQGSFRPKVDMNRKEPFSETM